MSVWSNYLDGLKTNKTKVKVFLTDTKIAMIQNELDTKRTMLNGFITDFDEESIILDKCLVDRINIISITPLDQRA
jgi:sRNA-binding regulator protein Hfq